MADDEALGRHIVSSDVIRAEKSEKKEGKGKVQRETQNAHAQGARLERAHLEFGNRAQLGREDVACTQADDDIG